MLPPSPSKQDNRKIKRNHKALAIGIAGVLLTGWYTAPAVGEPSAKPLRLNINKLITSAPKPDYDKEVLEPLRQKQAELAAKQEAARIEAERLAELERKKAEALELSRRVVQVALAPMQGDCRTWMSQAGITDMENAYRLIVKESGCNPNAVNRSSGACGSGQQLPCGKWPHAWNDPVGGLVDMQNYVFGRYGTWANAWAHSQAYGWY